MLCLEEQQDEFDFKYQTYKMECKRIKKLWLYIYILL